MHITIHFYEEVMYITRHFYEKIMYITTHLYEEGKSTTLIYSGQNNTKKQINIQYLK